MQLHAAEVLLSFFTVKVEHEEQSHWSFVPVETIKRKKASNQRLSVRRLLSWKPTFITPDCVKRIVKKKQNRKVCLEYWLVSKLGTWTGLSSSVGKPSCSVMGKGQKAQGPQSNDAKKYTWMVFSYCSLKYWKYTHRSFILGVFIFRLPTSYRMYFIMIFKVSLTDWRVLFSKINFFLSGGTVCTVLYAVIFSLNWLSLGTVNYSMLKNMYMLPALFHTLYFAINF